MGLVGKFIFLRVKLECPAALQARLAPQIDLAPGTALRRGRARCRSRRCVRRRLVAVNGTPARVGRARVENCARRLGSNSYKRQKELKCLELQSQNGGGDQAREGSVEETETVPRRRPPRALASRRENNKAREETARQTKLQGSRCTAIGCAGVRASELGRLKDSLELGGGRAGRERKGRGRAEEARERRRHGRRRARRPLLLRLLRRRQVALRAERAAERVPPAAARCASNAAAASERSGPSSGSAARGAPPAA